LVTAFLAGFLSAFSAFSGFSAFGFGAGIAGSGQRSRQQTPARSIVINHKDRILHARHPLNRIEKEWRATCIG